MSLGGVYSSILFYFSFNEIISISQIIGMIFMIICVIFLGLESADAGNRTINLPQGDFGSHPSEHMMK
jgi:drug/metabolite transporter (DMT)-like permease